MLFTVGFPTHTTLAVYSVHPNSHPSVQSTNGDASRDLSQRRARLQLSILTLSLSLTHRPQIQLPIRDGWTHEREPGESATLGIQGTDSACSQPPKAVCVASLDSRGQLQRIRQTITALTQGTFRQTSAAAPFQRPPFNTSLTLPSFISVDKCGTIFVLPVTCI